MHIAELHCFLTVNVNGQGSPNSRTHHTKLLCPFTAVLCPAIQTVSHLGNLGQIQVSCREIYNLLVWRDHLLHIPIAYNQILHLHSSYQCSPAIFTLTQRIKDGLTQITLNGITMLCFHFTHARARTHARTHARI